MTYVLRAAFVALVAAFAAAPAAVAATEPLDSYRVTAGGTKLEALAKAGYDVTEGRNGNHVVIVTTATEAAGLRAKGYNARLVRDSQGRTDRERAAAQAVGGYNVWRPYAEESTDGANLVEQLHTLAAENPLITKLEVIGHSVNGTPIYAMKVTKNARSVPDGQRPAVLYSSTQHAREWLSTETNRRMMRLFIDNYGQTGTARDVNSAQIAGVSSEELTDLVDHNELWFVLVCNPDGYDYTFSAPENRLWRKNLRDNDGDGVITGRDGVDPNRNFATHWGYDNEGSSDDPGSETFRGTAPQSEPETRALDGLMRRVNFSLNSNYHTFGELLLYPLGWQIETHAADEPVFRTLLGTDELPAVEGFNPGVGAELYITNGDTNDHAYSRYGTASFTPELAGGDEAAEPGAGGFVFQDVEADVEDEFERQIEYGLDLARSAADPANAVSHNGIEPEPFEIDSFDVSYGDPQTVQVNAKRELGAITLHYIVGGGDEQTAPTAEWKGGTRYGDEGDNWYHRMRGQVTGAAPGDTVKVWFEGGGEKSKAFTYTLASDNAADVLILAVENYSAGSAAYPDPSQPAFLSAYTDALDGLGLTYDIWDVDAHGMTAPNPFGILSHYKAVVWYTGNDYVTRLPGQVGGTGAAKVAHDIQIAVRDYLNEGGRVLITGSMAGEQYFDAFDYAQFGEPVVATADDPSAPQPGEFCDNIDQEFPDGCIPLSNDVWQYWLGGYIYAAGSGEMEDDDGNLVVFDALGSGDPFAGATLEFLQGDDGNQDDVNGPGSALVTSSLLPADQFPQFASTGVVDWVRPGADPYSPFTGDYFMYSGMSDASFRRVGTTVDLTGATDAALDFQTSFDTEPDWDFMFVEVHTVGQDNWTTLPLIDDAGDEWTDTFPGEACAADGDHWNELHPFLDHYQTVTGPTTCDPTGSSGDWHAVSGNSGGWEHLNADLSAFAGDEIEVFVSFAQDWAFSGLGVFLDDVRVTVDGAVATESSFEDEDIAPWAASVAPGTENPSTFTRTVTPFDEASGIRTAQSIWLTFGLEGLADAADRQAMLGQALGDLGIDVPDDGDGGAGGGAGGGGTPAPGAGAPGSGTKNATAGVVRVAKRAVRAKRNRRVSVRLWCPPTRGSTCQGISRLRSGTANLSGRSFAVLANRWQSIQMRLSRKAYRSLRLRGRLRATYSVASRGLDGVLRTDSARITILAPKRKK